MKNYSMREYEKKLKTFLSYCDEVSRSRNIAFFAEKDPEWPEQRIIMYSHGIIPGLYNERCPELLDLVSQPIDHVKLSKLLSLDVIEYEKSDLVKFAKQHGIFQPIQDISEPLLNWIACYNYLLAFPFCTTKEELLLCSNPEQVLSYVYIYLTYEHKIKRESGRLQFNFEQSNTKKLYRNIFDKSSEFVSWGLLPIDENRTLFSRDDPVRLYDSSIDKTVFLNIKRPLANVLEELIAKNYIRNLAIRTIDNYIYEGENHISILMEAVEQGRVFSWNLDNLPDMTRLYSAEYENCLWIKVADEDITFEELRKDFYDDGDYVVTQMIHLQHDGNVITHLDHEYIFYDLETYEIRMRDATVKGEGRRRIKTFKIDHSFIPMEYPCKMFKEDLEVEVPVIYFVLYNYFEHKDLLEEYFQNIL